MASNMFYLFKKIKTQLQIDYNEAIKGKTPEEIEIIKTRYSAELDKIQQKILAPIFSQYLSERVFKQGQYVSVEEMQRFVTDVRERAYGDRVEGDSVFSLSYFDDIKALLERSIGEIRGKIDEIVGNDQKTKKSKKEEVIDDIRREGLDRKRAEFQRKIGILEYAETDTVADIREQVKELKEKIEGFINGQIQKGRVASRPSDLGLRKVKTNKDRYEIPEETILAIIAGDRDSRVNSLRYYLLNLPINGNFTDNSRKGFVDALRRSKDEKFEDYTIAEALVNEILAVRNQNIGDVRLQALYKQLGGKLDTAAFYIARNQELIRKCNQMEEILDILTAVNRGIKINELYKIAIEQVSADERSVEQIFLEETYADERANCEYLASILSHGQIANAEQIESYKDKKDASAYLAEVLGIPKIDAKQLMLSLKKGFTTPEQKETFYKFQIDSLECSSEEMGLIIQCDRLEQLFGKSEIQVGKDGLFLYRAGYIDDKEDIISARAPGSYKMVGTHVGYGSSSENYQSPFISTTIDPLIMATYVHSMKEKEIIGSAPASQMVIDCSALHKIMSMRLAHLQNNEMVLPSEESFLRMLMELPLIASNPEYAKKIEEKIIEITQSQREIYQRDINLPTMIHPVIVQSVNDQEMQAIADVREAGEVYSSRELGEDRKRKLQDFGRASLEVAVKSCIPIRYESLETGETMIITREIDGLQSDFIQCLNISERDKITQFINQNKTKPVIGRLETLIDEVNKGMAEEESKVGLTRLEAEFARMYYIERRPLSEIKSIFTYLDIEADFNDDNFQLVLIEQMRRGIVGKLIRDPQIKQTLKESGIIEYEDDRIETMDVVKYGSRRSIINQDSVFQGRESIFRINS